MSWTDWVPDRHDTEFQSDPCDNCPNPVCKFDIDVELDPVSYDEACYSCALESAAINYSEVI